jgi:hypothetical protein
LSQSQAYVRPTLELFYKGKSRSEKVNVVGWKSDGLVEYLEEKLGVLVL